MLTDLPPLDIERIFPERINALSKLIAIALALLGRYQITEPICKQPTNSKQCDAVLLGSVLKGLMGLGVYQPIPAAPYPGMTVMGLRDRIERFPFMWDAAHGDTCGAAIRDDMKNTMKLVDQIVGGVNGLNLKNFKFKKGWGQVENLVATAVEALDDVIHQGQRHQECQRKEVVALSQVLKQEQDEKVKLEEQGEQGQRQRAEQEGQGEQKQKKQDEYNREDKLQEIGRQGIEYGGGGVEAKAQVGDEDEDLEATFIIDTASEAESATSRSVTTEPPAGAMDGFLETEETMQDFGPQAFFNSSGPNQTTAKVSGVDDDDRDRKTVSECSLTDIAESENENEEIVEANPPLVEDIQLEKKGGSPTTAKKLLIQENDMQNVTARGCLVEPQFEATESVTPERQKEQLRPEAKDFIPSFPLGPAPPERNRHHISMPRSRKELPLPLKPAPAPQHVASRANAEAKGQQWEAPGPGLVQKYQRGPRFPFHPEVTVGDVSEPDHTAETKRLKELFPEMDSKIIFEFLRQNNWNSEETAKVMRSGEVQMSIVNDGTVRFPVLIPTILNPPKPTIIPPQVSPGASISNTQQYSGDSAVKSPDPGASEDPTKTSGSYKDTASALRLVSGASTPSVADSAAHFWPVADGATVLRAVKLPENSATIRKLLAIFPSARADKGFINVLYRSGWDLEKAARKLEELGLARKVGNGDIGDAGKVKVKGKGKAEVKAGK